MGVPKFYKWLSERYPLINQIANSTIKPEFDNLYLDMNGIIHNCTHSDSDDLSAPPLSLTHMYTNIFAYLEKLMRIVQPKKLLYMAIDGVAPRAKMNQQRQRRFRSAKDAREALNAKIAAGELSPQQQEAERFDSNCITPGTEFMEDLSVQIRYFIRKKMKEDSVWQKVRVIFSGAEVPGEGEHKIMLYIRNMKMQPGYSANERHCLYGLDADLIMLSLSSHEPHFALLREEVVFGNSKLPRKSLKKLDEFQFLHISLLRDYLDLEFKPLTASLSFPYSLERIIDDWILLAALVGNDFLPHLPTLDIGEGGLDTLFGIYKEELAQLNGYLFENREIQWPRLERILKRMGELEEQVFAERESQAVDFAKRQRWKERRAPVIEIAEDELFEGEEPSPSPDAPLDSEDEQEEKHVVFDSQSKMFDRALHRGLSDRNQVEEPDEPQASFKTRYYRQKFPEFFDKGIKLTTGTDIDYFPPESTACIRQLVLNYIEGLTWVMKYYFEGCRSWKWYFAYRYAPLASDMHNLDQFNIKLTLGTPFRPLEQLLGVLPPASGRFLPAPYRSLMNPATSTIADFYPHDFSIDQNGKRSPWEGIALIPFIDEKRLLNAVHNIRPELLSSKERQRNERYGIEYVIQYDPSNKETVKSSYPAFANIADCNSTEAPWNMIGIPMNDAEKKQAQQEAEAEKKLAAETHSEYAPPPSYYAGNFIPGLCAGVKIPIAGFPSLLFPAAANGMSLAESKLAKISVNVFGMESKKDTLVVNFKPVDAKQEHAALLAQRLLQQRVFVGYPFLKESIVVSLTDGKNVYTNKGFKPLGAADIDQYKKDVIAIQSKFLNTKGMDIGAVHYLVAVNEFVGMRRTTSGAIKCAFSEEETVFPFQLIFPRHFLPDPRYQELAPPTIEDEFPLGSTCFYIGPQNYGSMGTILAHTDKKHVSVRLAVQPPDNNFGRVIAQQSRLQYYPSYLVAKSLNIHPLVLSKICSSVFVSQERIDIGLKIKFSKQAMQAPEYARRVQAWNTNNKDNGNTASEGGNEGWEYSEKTVALLAAYKKRFPLLFDMMNADPTTYRYDTRLLVSPGDSAPDPNNPISKTPADAVQEIAHWLTTVGMNNVILIPCTSQVIAERGIKAIEQESSRLAALKAAATVQEPIIDNVPMYHLYRPDPVVAWSPTSIESPDLGDRVLSVRSDAGVPLGFRGTVVAVHNKFAEIVFDQEFINGNHLNHKCSNLRGQTIPFTAFINLSKPKVLTPKQNAAAAKTDNKSVPAPSQQVSTVATNNVTVAPAILKRPVTVSDSAPPPSSTPSSSSATVNSATNALKQMLQIGSQQVAAPAPVPAPAPTPAAAPVAAANTDNNADGDDVDPMQRLLNKGKARKQKPPVSALPTGPLIGPPMHAVPLHPYVQGQQPHPSAPIPHMGLPHNAMPPPPHIMPQFAHMYPPPPTHSHVQPQQQFQHRKPNNQQHPK